MKKVAYNLIAAVTSVLAIIVFLLHVILEALK